MEKYFDKASTSKQKETAQQKPKCKYKEDYVQHGLLLQDPKITNNLSAFSAIKPYLMSRLFPASLADIWRKIIQHCGINQKNIL